MNGYATYTGYMGWIPSYHRYMLFSTESEYYEYFRETEGQ